MNRKILSFGLLVCAAAAFAEPSVTVSRVAPRFPWNGVVDIDYTIADLTGDATDYLVELSLNGVVLSNFVEYASCDLPLANGSNRVAWNASRDGYACEVSGAKMTAKLVKRVLTVTDARYLIVDLSGGASAASYPVRLAGECVAEEFNKDLYKTDRLVLKRVDKGDFWMGEGGYDEKGKQSAVWNGDVTYPGSRHRVRLTKDFYLGLFELTQKQYMNVVGSNPSTYQASKGTKDVVSRGEDLRRPVESINLTTPEETDGILDRLTKRALARTTAVGTFKYPTEAQWEFAARAGTTTMLPFGDYSVSRKMMDRNVVIGSTCDRYVSCEERKTGDVVEKVNVTNLMTSAVGMRLPNPWGFYDMFGNVSEFLSDWYVTPYSLVGGDGLEHEGTEDDPVIDPEMTETTDYDRGVRGQGYNGISDQYSMTSGKRTDKAGSNMYMGFRVSITLK